MIWLIPVLYQEFPHNARQFSGVIVNPDVAKDEGFWPVLLEYNVDKRQRITEVRNRENEI